MARDRRRAKQRQRQRRAGGGPARASGDRRPDATTPESDAEAAQQAGAPPADPLDRDADPTAPPDPIEHAAPQSEIAELAEASIQEPGAPEGPLEPDEYPQPDELVSAEEAFGDGDGAEATERGERRPARARTGVGAELPRDRNRLVAFLRASWAELQRVQWPNRRQVAQATAVVLVFVVIAGGYLGALDAVFSRLVDAIL
jgi:preprotein translocase subunit SecE